jgi:colicin import membrane protein
MEIASTIRERIFSAANALYEEGGGIDFPTVDAVRKRAHVNMNDASAGMKEWRRRQMVRCVPVAVHVPESVQLVANSAVEAIWKAAQERANESLTSAQSSWERDRVEADTLNKQISDAHESQSVELATCQAQIARLEAELTDAASTSANLRRTLDEMADELREARAGTERTEVQREEIKRRADDLRTELDHAHGEVVAVRTELSAMSLAHSAETDELRMALAAAKLKNETAAELARGQVGQLREENATLRGQIEVMTNQVSSTATGLRS